MGFHLLLQVLYHLPAPYPLPFYLHCYLFFSCLAPPASTACHCRAAACIISLMGCHLPPFCLLWKGIPLCLPAAGHRRLGYTSPPWDLLGLACLGGPVDHAFCYLPRLPPAHLHCTTTSHHLPPPTAYLFPAIFYTWTLGQVPRMGPATCHHLPLPLLLASYLPATLASYDCCIMPLATCLGCT